MATLPVAPALARRWWPAVTPAEAIAMACIGAALLLQLELAFAKSVNWDEFYHFSEIHQYRLGRWSPLLQTPYVYLYAWVPSLPGDNIAHIQLIRTLILPFELVTATCLYLMARRLGGQQAALLCTLAYVTGGYVFLHALAIRADMIAAALLSVALWLVLCRPLRVLETVAVAILLVLAFVATIKSVLYLPAFLLVWLYRTDDARARRAVLVLAAAGTAAAAILLALSAELPTEGPLATASRLIAYARGSLDRMFSAGLFPQGRYLSSQLIRAPVVALLIGLAIFAARNRSLRRRLAIYGLLAPLLTVAIYRNAFPYHFVFVLPPALAAAAPGAEILLRRFGLGTLSLVLLANAAVLSLTVDRSVLDRQRTVQAGVTEVFPTPIVYIDESGMIGDYPRAVARFASGWALENYHRAQRPDYRLALEKEPVPLLLANTPSLLDAFLDNGGEEQLLAEDKQVLRSNYIQHWGNVFVAGKTIAPGGAVMTEFAVPGAYTVEGGAVSINGRRFAPGQLVTVGRGMHRVQALEAGETILRWGDHLPQPAFAWPRDPLFTDY